MVDILCVADYIDRNNDIIGNYQGKVFPLEEVFENMKKDSGSLLAPCFVEAALEIRQEIRGILEDGREEAYRKAYELYL